jgi:hypothetical protein
VINPGEVIIHDGNAHHFVTDPVVDGETKKRGLIPRNYETHPVGCYPAIRHFSTVDFPLIPESEYAERIRDKVANKSQLSDRRNAGNAGQRIPSRDQNGKGYCWFHSGTSAQILLRAVMNEPYADLSAYAGACKIKGFRDEGGWGAQGVDFQAEKGIPTSQFWPQKSMDRANDNAATWENALLHRVQEGWIDAQAAQYDRKLSRQQVATLLLSGSPVVADYNWWGHSVCAADLVDGVSSFNQGLLRDENGKLLTRHEFDVQWGMNGYEEVGAGFGVRIWNSWGDSWSESGMGVLTANKAWPDGAVGLRTVTPSLI